MKHEKRFSIAGNALFYSMLFAMLLLLFGGLVGCEVTKEVVLDPNGVPSSVERVVVEGPGGDMVGVTVETIERLAPLLPEPWNSILIALTAGFSAATAGWVFRSKKEKKESSDGK